MTAAGNQIIKRREKLGRELHGILRFEMEAAGVVDNADHERYTTASITKAYWKSAIFY